MFFDVSYHQHQGDKLARRALKKIAKKNKKPYPFAVQSFVSGNESITTLFWQEILSSEKGKGYNRVEYCDVCQKFTLYYEKDE